MAVAKRPGLDAVQIDLPGVLGVLGHGETRRASFLGRGDQALAMNNTDPTGWSIEG